MRDRPARHSSKRLATKAKLREIRREHRRRQRETHRWEIDVALALALATQMPANIG